MTDWNALMDAAIIGTRGSKLETPSGMTPEAALLRRLALASAQRRAGYVAGTAKPRAAIEPPPPEVLPVCSEQELTWLTIINTAHLSPLIPEWCLLIVQRGKRVPHRMLPYVLKIAANHRETAPYIAQVIGERGKWMVDRSDGHNTLKAALALPALPTAPPDLPLDSRGVVLQYLDDQREQMLKDLSI